MDVTNSDITVEKKAIHSEDTSDISRQNGKKGISKKFKFRCHIENCNAAYRKNGLLEDHIRKHNKERPFVCNIPGCSKSFTKDPHLVRHKVMVHEKACEQVCDVAGCGKCFNNKYSLKKHKNKIHIESTFPFYCSECSKGFHKKWKLNQHMYIHTGEPPFKCVACNLGFTLARDLNKHTRNHKSYTCDCGEIFDRWSLLRHHKKDACTHIDKKCKNCGKSFTQKHNLQSHYKICNKDNENIQCPYMDCTRSYLYKRNLNWHIANVHEKDSTKLDGFKCTNQECEKVFSKKCFLNRHLKNSHGEKHKPKKQRVSRKDKGKPKSYIAATLSGIKLTQKDHIQLLNGNNDVLNRIYKKISETNAQSVDTENNVDSYKNINNKNDENNCTIVKHLPDKEIMQKNEKNSTNLGEYTLWKMKTMVENTSPLSQTWKVSNNEVNLKITSEETSVLNKDISDDNLLQECSTVLRKLEEYLV